MRLLKQSIAKVFCDTHARDDSHNRDIFSSDEGEIYLAHEVGCSELPREAKEVAHLVGYYRLSLMLIGGMINPSGKKKEPLCWNEVLRKVQDIRRELNLDSHSIVS